MTTNSAISTLSRERLLDDLEATHFDCLIIGGGITGAGIAREASRRGLSVAVVEAEDFGAGTSSRSSKLIHGGIRYLAQGDVSLVRETARERKHVRRIAPHLAVPAWMVIPVRSRASLLKFRAAVVAYEKLGAVESEDLHRVWDAGDLAENEPLIDRELYSRACVYREYITDDARLVLANLRAAARDGAVVIPHARIDGITHESGKVSGAEGVYESTGRRFRVRSRCVINAAGPWVEKIRKLEDDQAAGVLHLSKGIHVVVPREKLPVNHLVILSAPDGRSVFTVPRGQVVYVGTTDTSYGKAPDLWPGIDEQEVEYVLGPLARYFSGATLKPGDCIAAWSGLRPLVAQPGREPTEISRKDEVWRGPADMISIAGGKLTGYRKMALGVLEKVEQVLGRSLAEPSEEELPLPGGDFSGTLDALASALARDFEIDSRVAQRLAELYGSEAHDVLRLGSEPIDGAAPVIAGEAKWGALYEGAETLEDLVYRRMRLSLYEPAACPALLEPLAQQMAGLLGWDSSRVQEEVETVSARLRRDVDFLSTGETE